jgi:hypothetical protein
LVAVVLSCQWLLLPLPPPPLLPLPLPLLPSLPPLLGLCLHPDGYNPPLPLAGVQELLSLLLLLALPLYLVVVGMFSVPPSRPL